MNARSRLPCPLRDPLLGALLGAAALHWGQRVAAEESDAARLFDEGRALVVEGRYVEACPKLEQSQRLEPRLGTKLNVSFCHERLGKIATAWVGFREAALTARSAGDVAREGFAKARADALEPRVPWLRVGAAEGADVDRLTILLDGAPIAPNTWGKAVPVDPGEHALIAAHVGEEYWRTTVALRESEHVDVSIPAPKVTDLSVSPARPPATRSDGMAETANAPAAPPRAASRFVYELGAFIGYIAVDTNASAPIDAPSALQAVVLDDDDTSRTLSCDSAPCSYSSLGSTSGFVAGVAGFVGYAAAEHTSLGLRFLFGPRVGGGALIALGPSASFLFGERFSVGPSVFFGTASHAELGEIQLHGPNGPSSIYDKLHATLGFSLGLGAELGVKLISTTSGTVVLQVTPLFLYGPNGMSLSLPLGAAYRWN